MQANITFTLADGVYDFPGINLHRTWNGFDAVAVTPETAAKIWAVYPDCDINTLPVVHGLIDLTGYCTSIVPDSCPGCGRVEGNHFNCEDPRQ